MQAVMQTFKYPISDPVFDKSKAILESEFLPTWSKSEIGRILNTAQDTGILSQYAKRRLTDYIETEAKARAEFAETRRPGRYLNLIELAKAAPFEQLRLDLEVNRAWRNPTPHVVIIERHKVTGRFDHWTIRLDDPMSSAIGFIDPTGALDPLEGGGYGRNGVSDDLAEALDICDANGGTFVAPVKESDEADEADEGEDDYEPGDYDEDEGDEE